MKVRSFTKGANLSVTQASEILNFIKIKNIEA